MKLPKQRIQQTHDFISTLTVWANEMLGFSLIHGSMNLFMAMVATGTGAMVLVSFPVVLGARSVNPWHGWLVSGVLLIMVPCICRRVMIRPRFSMRWCCVVRCWVWRLAVMSCG